MEHPLCEMSVLFQTESLVNASFLHSGFLCSSRFLFILTGLVIAPFLSFSFSKRTVSIHHPFLTGFFPLYLSD